MHGLLKNWTVFQKKNDGIHKLYSCAEKTTSTLADAFALKTELQDAHAQNALLLREYLIEKSGRFMDDGWDKNDADNEAAWIAAEKFGASLELCFGILSRV